MSTIAATNIKPTVSDVLGPFYKPGAPLRNDGSLTDRVGVDPSNGQPTRLTISGKVQDDQGNALPGATLDVWQAGPPDERGLGSYDMATFDLRGKVIADANGKYSFSTVIPGHYSLNGDDQPPYRPEHIHVAAAAPGDSYGAVQAGDRYQIVVDKGNKFNVLVTQLYFQNDGDVDHKEQSDDPFFTENEGEERAVQLTRTPANGYVDAQGNIDITLAPVPSNKFHTAASRN